MLFFYPIVKQKPLQQGLLPIIFSNCFFSKNAATQHKPTREAKYSLCRFFLPHCQLLSIDGNFTNFYQRCSLWESLTSVYGCRSPYIYWIFRGFYGIVKSKDISVYGQNRGKHMLALKHDSLRKLGIAAGWFILAGVFRQLDHALSPLLSAMCFLATNLIYIALALVWGISVRRRILHRDVRRYLLLSCAMAVLWLLLRAFKYRYFQSDGISRALWYCYYIPQIFAPLFGFFGCTGAGTKRECAASALPAAGVCSSLPAASGRTDQRWASAGLPLPDRSNERRCGLCARRRLLRRDGLGDCPDARFRGNHLSQVPRFGKQKPRVDSTVRVSIRCAAQHCQLCKCIHLSQGARMLLPDVYCAVGKLPADRSCADKWQLPAVLY